MTTSDSWQPWLVLADGSVAQRKDAPSTFDDGDWPGVERFLDVRLPRDYKELIGDGAAWCLDAELYIASPFDRSWHNLFDLICVGTWAAAFIRASGFWELDYAVYPEPGGLPWGADQNGGYYYWDTQAADPDLWTTVIDGRGVEMGPVPFGVTAYLNGLIERTIRPASYDPDQWPTAGHLVRVAASGC